MPSANISNELKNLDRLIGQHPASLRSVSWNAHGHHEPLAHLELETKHGHVVVFDHSQPIIYSAPPRPAGTVDPRTWHDLSEQVPQAFDNRPTLSSFSFQPEPVGWLITLSTGVTLSFLLDEERPTLQAQ